MQRNWWSLVNYSGKTQRLVGPTAELWQKRCWNWCQFSNKQISQSLKSHILHFLQGIWNQSTCSLLSWLRKDRKLSSASWGRLFCTWTWQSSMRSSSCGRWTSRCVKDATFLQSNSKHIRPTWYVCILYLYLIYNL